MELALKIFDRLLPFIVPKKVRLTNEIERLDKIIRNESDEKLLNLHNNKRRQLSFQYNSGLNAHGNHIDQLINISNALFDVEWFQIKDAYRVWDVKNGVIQTSLGRKKKMLGGALFTAGVSAFTTGAWIAFFVGLWERDTFLPAYFLSAFACLFLGFLSFTWSLYFKEAERIHRKLLKKESNS